MSDCPRFTEVALRSAPRIATVLLCALLLASCGFRKSRLMAEAGVKEFHALLDREQYEQIYEQGGDSLRKSTSKVDFIAYLQGIHSRLGNTRKTTASGFSVNTSPGEGAQVALAMETEFDRGVAQERFLWRVSGGRAVLLDYHAEIERSTGPRTVQGFPQTIFSGHFQRTLFSERFSVNEQIGNSPDLVRVVPREPLFLQVFSHDPLDVPVFPHRDFPQE